MCVCGPGSEKNEAEREAFWNDLDDCLQSFGANESIVLLGDLNARVGDEVIEDVVGRHEVSGRNENGENIIGLCMEKIDDWKHLFRMYIHRYTWVRQYSGRVVDRAMMDYAGVSWNNILM